MSMLWWSNWEKARPLGDALEPFCFSHATREAYLRVMQDFKEFFLHQSERAELERTVNRLTGRRLSLGIPHNWHLEVCSADSVPELASHVLDDLLCCREKLIVLGRCVVALGGEGGEWFAETDFLVMMGYRTRMYVYDMREECLVMAALDLDELARFGLLTCECIYRFPATPYATSSPWHVVRGMLDRCGDVAELARFCDEMSGTDVILQTPGRRAKPMRVTSRIRDLRSHWPVAALSDVAFQLLRRRLTIRLCCAWHPIGAVGTYRCSGYFHLSHLILVDRFCVVYTLEIRTGSCYRLAGDLHEFFRAGLVKTLSPRRYDNSVRRKALLERPSQCRHALYEIIRPPFTVFEPGVAHRYDRQFQWLCRENRFRPNMLQTWDEEDAPASADAWALELEETVRRRFVGADEPDDEDEAPERRPVAVVRPGSPRRRLFLPAWRPPPADAADDRRRPRREGDVEDDDDDENGRQHDDLGIDVREGHLMGRFQDQIRRWRIEDELASAYDSEKNVTVEEVEARRVVSASSSGGDREPCVIFNFRQFL